jgi:hypothetical protein
MKFAICFVVLAFVACAYAKPGGAFSGNDAFEGDLDLIQGSLDDIKNAGSDLGVIEGKLDGLVQKKADIEAAELALQTAVDKTAYTNAWV